MSLEEPLPKRKKIDENMSSSDNANDAVQIKQEARTPEDFLNNPILYFPKPEFLSNLYIEVST